MLLGLELDLDRVDRELRGVQGLLADQPFADQLPGPPKVALRILDLDLLAAHRDLRLAEGRPRLVPRRFVEVAFDLEQDLAGLDLLPFDDRQRDDLADDLGRDLDLFLGRDLAGRLDAG